MSKTGEKLPQIEMECEQDNFEATIEKLKDIQPEFITISASRQNDDSVLLVYFFRENKRLISLKVVIKDGSIQSLYSTFGMADFIEREINSLFGIKFIGHPNLDRKNTQ